MLGFLVPKDLAKLMLKKKKKMPERYFSPKRRVMGSETEHKRSRSSLLNLLWQKFNRITSSGSNSKLPGGGTAGGPAQSIAFLKINHQEVTAAVVIKILNCFPCFSLPPL